jgi:hypothetical protein
MVTAPRASCSESSGIAADDVLAGCTVDLFGVPTRLVAEDPDGARALARVLRAARSTDTAPRVEVRACVEGPTVPDGDPTSRSEQFEVWRAHAGVRSVRHVSGLTARATRDAIEIGGTAERFDEMFRRTCVLALAYCFAQHDRPFVHASAIATGRRAVLVLGASGAGKSTVAFSALRAGWRVLSDDIVAMSAGDTGPGAAGLPRPLAVPPGVLDGARPSSPMPGDPRGRHELGAEAISHGWYPVGGCLVVRHATEPRGTVEAIDAHAMFEELLGSFAPVEHADDVRRVFPLAAALARRPRAALRLARDPATRVSDTMALLDRIRAEFGFVP